MLDTLLLIPDAEYPAFYPIGIKAVCGCADFQINATECNILHTNTGSTFPESLSQK